MPTFNYTLQSKRNFNNGTVYSATFPIPASVGEISVQLDATDLTGAGQRASMGIEISEDGGATWEPWASISASSEPRTTKGDPLKPAMTMPFNFPGPLTGRAFLTVENGPFQLGVSASVTFA